MKTFQDRKYLVKTGPRCRGRFRFKCNGHTGFIVLSQQPCFSVSYWTWYQLDYQWFLFPAPCHPVVVPLVVTFHHIYCLGTSPSTKFPNIIFLGFCVSFITPRLLYFMWNRWWLHQEQIPHWTIYWSYLSGTFLSLISLWSSQIFAKVRHEIQWKGWRGYERRKFVSLKLHIQQYAVSRLHHV